MLGCAWLICAAAVSAAKVENTTPSTFDFALIGDAPYNGWEEVAFDNMRMEINKADLAFVVHDGDFKNGASECSDELYQRRLATFNSFAHPFIYLFGDNDWMDCERWFSGGYDSIERLARLRQVFTQGDTSLGKRTLRLERQSAQRGYELFRENVRWSYGGVQFVGLHIIGGSNNLRSGRKAYKEFSQRNAANLAWVEQSFALAKKQNARAVMIIMQANPRFEWSPQRRKGYNDFLDQLQQETIEFGKPVVLVHGDTHHFHINKPMKDPKTGKTVENFTRLETFGSPFVRWVKATVDPRNPDVFTFTPMNGG